MAHVDVHHLNMQQSADVYFGENGHYYAAIINAVWDHIGIAHANDVKDALSKAYDLAELRLTQRVVDAAEEARKRSEVKVKEKK